ncbi:hemerythrin domain-containing protein [Lagierella sp.]|uniref:hemerythrin domain-containing protein n=1 Tax=Lagierella sp. TaxID=2849657 RepID=UPI00261C8F18|nr:hemerythrin domain-containing protein [Lagierella sp.]
MKSIEVLVLEHEEISRLLERLEEECVKILEGSEIDYEFFENSIEFIRDFADRVHHMKEEDILFKHMSETLGVPAQKLINSGMLVEHQMGRHYITELEKHLETFRTQGDITDKLQIISYTMSYVNLLRMHIEKENTVVYPFGEKNLPKEVIEKVEEESTKRQEEDKVEEDRKEKLLKKIFR